MAKTKDVVLGTIISFLIGGFLGGLFISYWTTPTPILFSAEPCDKYIDLDSSTYKQFEFSLKNQAETPALVTACLKSQEVYFKSANGDLVHTYCFGETGIHPKSSELQINFKAPISKLEDNMQDNSNATINLGVSCRYKIWSLLSKECQSIGYSCIYLKQGNSLRLKESI